MTKTPTDVQMLIVEDPELIRLPYYTDYAVGSDGYVYSYKRGPMPYRLTPQMSSNGDYLHVMLSKGKERWTIQIHRLVCSTFNGKAPEGYEVSHLNGNSWDNRPENLKWETRSENLARRIQHGTDDCGARNSRAKLDKEQVNEVRKHLKDGALTHKQIGELYGVSRVFITKINTGYRYARD